MKQMRFLLLLYFYIEQSLSTTVFLESTDSDRNLIDISKTAEKDKDVVVTSLLAAHVLTRCDSVPKLYGLGKKFALCCKNTCCKIWGNISDVIQEGITSTKEMSEIWCVF